MSRKRRSTFALSNSCRVIKTRRGQNPRFGFVAEITQMEAAGLWEALCRLHSLPDEFHFLLHYFLFTAVYISTFICFTLLFYFYFFRHKLPFCTHSMKAFCKCSFLPRCSFFTRSLTCKQEVWQMCVTAACWNVSTYQGTSSECSATLSTWVPDVDSVSKLFFSFFSLMSELMLKPVMQMGPEGC